MPLEDGASHIIGEQIEHDIRPNATEYRRMVHERALAVHAGMRNDGRNRLFTTYEVLRTPYIDKASGLPSTNLPAHIAWAVVIHRRVLAKLNLDSLQKGQIRHEPFVMLNNVKSGFTRLWRKDDSTSGWETQSCADSSKSPFDEENLNHFQDANNKPSNQQASEKTIKPWRTSYPFKHPAQAFRILFGKMTDDDQMVIMQGWCQN